MKKLPLIITLSIVLLAVAGIYLSKFLKHNVIKPWDLVPHDAVIVYEKGNCASCIANATTSSAWQLIERAMHYKKPADSIVSRIKKLFGQSRDALASVHLTKKDDFDLIYYVTFRDPLEFGDLKGFRQAKRLFNGINIVEVRSVGAVFSYAQIDEVWVGSFTPFLIEDVIREHKSKSNSGPESTFGKLQFSSIQDDAGNLYLQLRKLGDLLSIFIGADHFDFELGRSTLLDIKGSDNAITLNGFSTDSINNSDYLLSNFQHQSPVSFGLKNLIPNRVVAVKSYGISSGELFARDLKRFARINKSTQRDSLDQVSRGLGIDFDELDKLISDEIAICTFESAGAKSFSSLALIETSDVRPWRKAFMTLADKLSQDTVFYDPYGSHEIREVPVYKFTQKLLWPLAKGFARNYYTTIGNVIVMGEDPEELKSFLDDIESDDTWGRSVSQNQFLETTLLESNVSLYVNTSRLWNLTKQRLQPRWQNFMNENRALTQSIGMASFQFSHLNNSFYTNAIIAYKPSRKNQTPSNTTTTIFPRGIQSIHSVRSHVNRSNEILVQDSLNDLSLVSSEGKVLWKIAVGDRIISEVSQIDFFNNGKLQYFFATQFSIHVVDRLGNYVQPFPIHLDNIDVDQVNVIDYDNSKKYRFLVADKAGKIFMYDKDGKNLDGWQPNDAGGQLSTYPRHYRIQGRDYIVAARKDGIVNVWTRRGEKIKPFPLSVEGQPIGDMFLERGNSLANSYVVVVTRDGYRVRVSPEGKIQSREALVKSSVRSTFGLIAEKSNKSYLIFQQDEKQLSISDAEGKKILSAPVAGLQPVDIRYFDFGSGKTFVLIKDKTQGFSYVYDGEGNLLTEPPVETSMIELRPGNSDQFILFFIHDKELAIRPM